MALSTLDALMGALRQNAVQKPRSVSIKGLGDVYIRELTVGEIDEQIEDVEKTKDKRRAARGACRLFSDENGNRLLDPDNEEHVAEMAKQPWSVLRAINESADAPGN